MTLAPGALEARLAAHRRGYAMVTGTLLNGRTTWPGCAAYFLEGFTNLPGLPAGEICFAPTRCSYLRAAIDGIGGFPETRSAEDTRVNQRLWARGYGAYREPAITLVHRNPCVSVPAFFRHHMIRGAGWGRMMIEDHDAKRLFTVSGSRHWIVGMLPARLWLIARSVWQTQDTMLKRRFVCSSPLIIAGAVTGWLKASMALLSHLLRPGALFGDSATHEAGEAQ